MRFTLQFVCFSILLFSSCSSYQVYQTESSEEIKTKNNLYVFENDDISIVYDFWSEAGILALRIKNESDKEMMLNFEKSFFTINGDKLPYFSDALAKYSVIIPPTDHPIEPLSPGEKIELEGYPLPFIWQRFRKKNRRYSFNEKTTPLTIKNELVYSFKNDDRIVKNNFWVSSIEKMRHRDFRALNHPEVANADKFYMRKDRSGIVLGVLEASVDILEITAY